MTTGYRIYDQQGLYYLTFHIVDWVDIFRRGGVQAIMLALKVF
jgi:hypothetical protein